jgi:pimeloyl-ACP methyl ester carboxylesterase
VDVAYEVVGSGPPVLLVSGLSQTGARWRRVAERLAKPAPGHPLGGDPRTFTVVTADNRETGGTGPCPDGFTLADVAQDLLALMTRLGHQRFFLGGISMGGMIAQEILGAAPDRVRAAVLLATHSGHEQSVQADPTVLMVPDAQTLWTRLSGPGFAEAHPDVIEEEARLSVQSATPLDGVMRQMQAIFQYDMGERLAGLAQSMPVAVAHGDHDPLVPYENGVRLAAQLGVPLVTYEGSGHGLEFERPDEVAALMRATFARANP